MVRPPPRVTSEVGPFGRQVSVPKSNSLSLMFRLGPSHTDVNVYLSQTNSKGQLRI